MSDSLHAAQDAYELLQFELVKLEICEGCKKKVYELVEDLKARVVEEKVWRMRR